MSGNFLEHVLKKALAENDTFVIPKVISEVVEMIGVEKTAELSGLNVVNSRIYHMLKFLIS